MGQFQNYPKTSNLQHPRSLIFQFWDLFLIRGTHGVMKALQQRVGEIGELGAFTFFESNMSVQLMVFEAIDQRR